jgi:hypothetical protein
MTMRYAMAVLIIFVCAALPASADVFGLGPTLAGKGPGLVVEQRGASGPLPSQIVGLEGYALWGKNGGAAGAVNYRHRFASTPVGDRQIRWRYGILGGAVVADEVANPLLGPFVEGEVEGIAGVIVILRVDDGVYLNFGAKINFVSVSF